MWLWAVLLLGRAHSCGLFLFKIRTKITCTWQGCPELNSHTLLQGSIIIPRLVKTQMLPNLCRQILHFRFSYIKTNSFSWYCRLKTWYLTLFITSDPSLVPVLGLGCNKSMLQAMSCSWFYSESGSDYVALGSTVTGNSKFFESFLFKLWILLGEPMQGHTPSQDQRKGLSKDGVWTGIGSSMACLPPIELFRFSWV